MIYFVRHGQSQANVRAVFAGPRLDAPLTDEGRAQAVAAARHIQTEHLHIDHIIASPVERAHTTAVLIAETLGIAPDSVRLDSRLAEYDMGSLSGQPLAGVTASQLVTAPGAENPKEFQRRVEAGLEDAKELPGNTLVVSHAGVGRMLETTRRGLDPATFFELPPYPNAQVVSLKED